MSLYLFTDRPVMGICVPVEQGVKEAISDIDEWIDVIVGIVRIVVVIVIFIVVSIIVGIVIVFALTRIVSGVSIARGCGVGRIGFTHS